MSIATMTAATTPPPLASRPVATPEDERRPADGLPAEGALGGREFPAGFEALDVLLRLACDRSGAAGACR